MVKSLSVTGEEAVRLSEHVPECMSKVKMGEDQRKLNVRARRHFVEFFNCLNARVHDDAKGGVWRRVADQPLLNAKSDELWNLGRSSLVHS